ncbi:hypothetical protein H8B06_10440 [Sphingobacterium sp. DN00404]|uniref:Uncharacterized protein n=1 Tax=Sphingobacterium micropteri TaxID=2763501 RepID=A0ABR7YPV1_9SPHI|nr:hypothetical protein [Sphingobacterium micropteri]MBD1433246.1 hypothetical protein [Sphingobacterium micropteri]
MKKKVIIWIVAVVVVSNLPIINGEILRGVDSEYFRYSNADATFTYIDHFGFKSGGYFNKRVSEEGIKRDLNSQGDTIEIFRLYRINPLCFWRWSYYIIVSRQFRYKSWKEIEPRREPFNKRMNPLQRF